MAKNPWMSLWLSAANTWAGAARRFWAADEPAEGYAELDDTANGRTYHQNPVIQESFDREEAES